MKKRFLAVFLALAMCVPGTAVFAADAGSGAQGNGAAWTDGITDGGPVDGPLGAEGPWSGAMTDAGPDIQDSVTVDPGDSGAAGAGSDEGDTVPDSGPGADQVITKPVYPSFDDVQEDHWARGYVGRACWYGWIGAPAYGDFKPDGTVTYAEMCEAICAAVYLEEGTGSAHESTMPGWYMGVSTAAGHGVLSGTPMANEKDWDKTADESVSRGMMAVMLDNVLRDTGVVDRNTGRGAAGGEFDEMPSGVVNALLDCRDAGIIDGYPDGRFGHGDVMTRCQLAKVICILHDVVLGAECG